MVGCTPNWTRAARKRSQPRPGVTAYRRSGAMRRTGIGYVGVRMYVRCMTMVGLLTGRPHHQRQHRPALRTPPPIQEPRLVDPHPTHARPIPLDKPTLSQLPHPRRTHPAPDSAPTPPTPHTPRHQLDATPRRTDPPPTTPTIPKSRTRHRRRRTTLLRFPGLPATADSLHRRDKRAAMAVPVAVAAVVGCAAPEGDTLTARVVAVGIPGRRPGQRGRPVPARWPDQRRARWPRAWPRSAWCRSPPARARGIAVAAGGPCALSDPAARGPAGAHRGRAGRRRGVPAVRPRPAGSAKTECGLRT